MISEQFKDFLSKWLTEKETAIDALSKNKIFNNKLKEGMFSGQSHPKDKRIYQLKKLISSQIIKNKIPSLLHSQCGLPKYKYKTKGSIGQGMPVEVPWLCVFDLEITESAQEGYYIVYLFNSNMSGVYL